jgi:hypothetical protein
MREGLTACSDLKLVQFYKKWKRKQTKGRRPLNSKQHPINNYLGTVTVLKCFFFHLKDNFLMRIFMHPVANITSLIMF